VTELADEQKVAPSFYDGWKRVFLGKPMITDDLQHEKLSNPVALGALSPDAISSTAYGPEQIMVELLPAAGMAAFVLLLPLIGVILLILALVAASYRQVVAPQAGDQLVGGHLVDERGGDLCDRKIQRRSLAGRGGLPNAGAGIDAAQSAISRRGVGLGDVAHRAGRFDQA
jgi:hypothetical protein